MPSPNKELTLRETAAILAFSMGIIKTPIDAYIAADDKPTAELAKQTSLHVSVSRWINSPKVVNEIKKFKKLISDRLADERQSARSEERAKIEAERIQDSGGESEQPKPQTKTATKALIDYTDPKNQNRKLNELINTADDPGEALDALKVIISTQKADREAAKEQKIVRSYLPLSCADCPLMQRERKKRGTT